MVATAFGGPEVLAVVDVPVRQPGPGEVVVAVRAIGVNPGDWWAYSGRLGSDPSTLPLRLGLEAAGVVVATGGEVTGPAGPVSVGDEVIACRVDGAYAGTLVVPAEAVVPKPPTLSFTEAAALLVSGTTAFHALMATGVEPGNIVVVHGASGGVGLMAVQLAVASGARVIGTAGEGHHAALRELGAEPVTYGPGLADRLRRLAPDRVDAVVDAVGTDEAIDASLPLVRHPRQVATLAGFGRGRAAGIQLLGRVPGADPGTAVRAAARLDVARRAAVGELVVRVARCYSLEDAAAAHRESAAGHPGGKLVLVP